MRRIPAHVAEPARAKGRMPTEPAAEAVPEKAFNGPPLAPANNPRPTTVTARSRRAEPPSAALKGVAGEAIEFPRHARASAFATASADQHRGPGEALAQTGVPDIRVFLSATFPDKTWRAGTFG